jgi:ParB family chromosome partitioning protein
MASREELERKTKEAMEDAKRKKELRQKEGAPQLRDHLFSTGPGLVGAAQDRLFWKQKAEELEKQLELAAESSTPQEIKLIDLHEAPGRKRKLSDQEFSELRENLRNNPLVTPITVRKRAEGGYEIISGHNRVAVFRELEKDAIPAVVADADELQADVNAFYANLLHNSLPDFEKFRGFKMLQEKFPNLTQAEIARRSGSSESLISRLMSFGDLPEEITESLEKTPGILGAGAAYKLAALSKAGNRSGVLNAFSQLVEGKIDQEQAVKLAATPAETKPAKQADSKTIKAGTSNYCVMRCASKVVRLEFKNDVEAKETMEALEAFLTERAKKSKVK